MKIRSTLSAGAALALAGGALVVAPATAATDGGTVGTFEIVAGDLSISVPTGTVSAPKDLGDVAVGSAVFAPSLGEVKVTDNRTNLTTSWTATVSSTNFVTGDGSTADEKVLASEISYVALPGAAVPTQTGIGVFTGGVVASLDATALATLRTAGLFEGTGANSIAWSPTVTFSNLGDNVAGVYTGTVTHSVS